MFSLLAFICIGSTFCQVISGLTLISNVYGFTNGFSLTCKVQGTITTQLTLTDPAGNVAAGCFQPPSGCGSSAGNTFDRNIPEGTFTVNIIPANVNVANHKGVWTCSDGVNIAQYEIKEIVSYTEPIIQSEVEAPITGSVITVLIGCIYPYPDEVKISYVKESSQDTVLKSRSDVKFDNGSSVNCKSSDARAISMNGSFLVSTDNLNGEEARIAVTVLLNGNVLGKIGYSNFTIKSEKGVTTPSTTISSDMSTTVSESSSTFSSDMSTTVSEPSSTFSSDMPTTVSEAPLPPITTSSRGLPQEILIAIVISSVLAGGLLILLTVLVMRQCMQKTEETPAENKENHFANKQNSLTKKDNMKSYKPRKYKFSEKRNTKQGSASLDKKKDVRLENFAPKDRIYQHYPQTTDYWDNYGNQHVFNNSHIEGNMMSYGNRHDNYLRPHSRPNSRMLYQSQYPPYPGHKGMFQYYTADNSYRGQQTYQRPYVALYDMNIIDDKQDEKRSFKGRPYEKNWDLLY